jgi:hypothetical protein
MNIGSPSIKKKIFFSLLSVILFLLIGLTIVFRTFLKEWGFVPSWISLVLSVLLILFNYRYYLISFKKNSWEKSEPIQFEKIFENHIKKVQLWAQQVDDVIDYSGIFLYCVIFISAVFLIYNHLILLKINLPLGATFSKLFVSHPWITWLNALIYACFTLIFIKCLNDYYNKKLLRLRTEITTKLITSKFFLSENLPVMEKKCESLLQDIMLTALRSTELGLHKKTARWSFWLINRRESPNNKTGMIYWPIKRSNGLFFNIKKIVPLNRTGLEYDELKEKYFPKMLQLEDWKKACKELVDNFNKYRDGNKDISGFKSEKRKFVDERFKYGSDLGVLSHFNIGQCITNIEKSCQMHDPSYLEILKAGDRFKYKFRSAMILPIKTLSGTNMGMLGFYSSVPYAFDKSDYKEIRWYRDLIALLMEFFKDNHGKYYFE